MRPSKTVFVRGIMQAPATIAYLGTGVLLTLLPYRFRMTLPEALGVSGEIDARRERDWRKNGRYSHRYAPTLRENSRSFGTGYFDVRYFQAKEGGYLVTF